MTFWLSAAVLTALVVAILWPALRARGTAGTAVYDARLAVYRDRLAELDADLAAGTIDPARHAEARAEIEDAAAAELVDEEPRSARRSGGLLTFAALLVVVPAIAFVLYAQLGAREDVTAAATPPHDLDQLVAQLAERMAQAPDDVQGWMLLGRSRIVLGDLEGGVVAWREAHRLAPDDPTVLANLGEALVLADPATLDGEAALLVERALAVEPENPKALWYAGLAAEARGEPELARQRWGVLLTQDPPDALREAIERRVAGLPPAE